ncbi:hypothetical protein CDO52_09575 [Nocardiopsis gilva YIM 90087]|uniref:Uncharacterized protein n=1 Tax=Nocardiopsis gilva YIM 90087 TaxID=1235441 RepID=A0A223S4E0_9ACTN|nr:hypothetical protein [Nocardiopsis gilva]ASU83006.1 hypothetical protein CDO52_09575 [Nocardiopsis gilva YIM 90087]
MSYPYYGPQYGPPQPPPPPPPAPQAPPDIQGRLLGEPFAAVAPHLRVFLTGDPSALGTDKLAYSINSVLTALVVFRPNPHSIEAVVLEKRHAHAWGMTKQDLWFTALTNTAGEPIDVRTYQTNADTPVHAVMGMGWPGSAHVMRLTEIAQEPLPYGAVVMLPNANTMIYSVLRSKRSAPIIPFLYQTFQSLVGDDAPFTDQFLWWRGGKLTAMSTRPDPGGGVQLAQTKEFSFLLDHELPD